jgi:antirestriction protein ArdC
MEHTTMSQTQYQAVTDRIITMLEQGTRPWAKSWKPGTVAAVNFVRPLSGATGKPYTGINTLSLWVAAELRGFQSRYWFTFKAAKAAGGSVKKGAKAELAFYVGKHTVRDAGAPEGDESERTISFLKAYPVFNADECEGLPAKFYAAEPVAPAPVVNGRIESVDSFVANLRADIAHGGDRAFYMPSTDAVRMPHLAQFDAPESYYAVLLHELTHWTAAPARCDRQLGKRFGDDAYAAEELVAELGAAFLCADLAISAEPREDHASYLASWLRVLKADNRAIFRAAALAERAAGYMHAQQPAADPLEVIEGEAEPLAMAA